MTGFSYSAEQNYQTAVNTLTEVNTLLSGGYKVSLQQLVDAYNRLSDIHERIAADVVRARSQMHTNSTAIQQMINDVSSIGPDANAVLDMAHITATVAYTGDASFYQNLVVIEARLAQYMSDIYDSIKKYAGADYRVAESLAKIARQSGN